MRILTFVFILSSMLAKAQHTGFSYNLMNEVGTYSLSSLTFSHVTDNTEGITYVIHKQHGDTVYHLDEFLNGFVALSNDGKTIGHFITEENGKPLEKSVLTFYRDGKKFDHADLEKFLVYELKEAQSDGSLPNSGWLRNDSLLHKMATNPFYVTDDKVFLSFDNPRLMVFDMNLMFHIYSGNGANHFFQNYFSIPNPPFRTEFNSKEYIPSEFPETIDGKSFESLLTKTLKSELVDAKSANIKVEITFKLSASGETEMRSTKATDVKSNQLDTDLSDKLQEIIAKTAFSTVLIPPGHPEWNFHGEFFLK